MSIDSISAVSSALAAQLAQSSEQGAAPNQVAALRDANQIEASAMAQLMRGAEQAVASTSARREPERLRLIPPGALVPPTGVRI